MPFSVTMLTIAANPKHLGARIGITAILQTWGSALTHHPHVHMIVPDCGIALDGTRWISPRPVFLLPVRVLGALFRRLFLTRLLALFDAGKLAFFNTMAGLATRKAFLRHLSPIRKRRWVVYANGCRNGPARTSRFVAWSPSWLSFNKSVLPAEQLRPAIARRLEQRKKYQGRLDPAQLGFIDESCALKQIIRGICSEAAKTNTAPLRGWAPVGQRLHAKVRYGHWRTMTFLATLRCDQIEAPCVLNQPVNGPSFTDYVEQFLVPTLSPGDVVIMDNLTSHKRPAMRKAIRGAGAKLLSCRRTKPRTHKATWRRIGTLLDAFSPDECRNYLRNAGYDST